jgi:hypothetical protein
MFASCGGSSSGGDSSFSGDYRFILEVERDECALNLGSPRELLFRVEQSGSTVVAENLITGVIINGFTIGNGWIVSQSEQVILPTTAQVCNQSIQLAYDGGNRGAVAMSRVCPVATSNAPASECWSEYSGVVNRL